MTLLGIPWTFGYFILDTDETLIFSYIFTILNSSQGTILFFFHCIASKSVRDEIIKYICSTNNTTLILSRSNSKTNSSTKTSNNDRHMVNNSINNSSSKMRQEKYKEKHSKLLYQFLSCMSNKNIYELKNDNNLNSNNIGDNNLSPSNHLQSAEDDSNAELIIYEPLPNEKMKNPLHFHPHHLPKRSSSHASSNSSNSNRTHLTYVPPLVSNAQAYVVTPTPTTLPLYLRPANQNSVSIKRATYTTYYLIPSNSQQENVKSTGVKYIIPSSSIHDGSFNYANQNLPSQQQARMMPLNIPVTTTTTTGHAEEHNYSLIESEFQTDLQYYCDEPICSNAIEEDDFNTNSYTEVPNQYDELDDIKMLASSCSSLSSSLTKPFHKNQITIPKTASRLAYNKS
jgi:hypothetical protein